ncbi:FecR domain-containing protein [Thermaurantiacus sp.]
MRATGPLLLVILGGASVASSPAAPPAAPRATDTGDFLIYEAKDGDTLPRLARDHFVREEDWRKALALNRLPGPELAPGTRIRLDRGWLKREPLSAELIAFRGAIRIRSGGEEREAQRGARLGEGDQIATGAEGFATLRFPDGSLVSLPTNSAVRLDRLRRYPIADSLDRRLVIERGEAESSVVPLQGGGSRFEVSTPLAVSAVRGTRFRAHFTPGALVSATEVLEGVVGVRPREAPTEARVAAGYGVVVTDAGMARPEALPVAPVALDMPAVQSGPRVVFSVRPQPGARGYRAELATDPDFLDRLAAATSTDGRFALEDVPAGRFHLRVVAISQSGLAGVPATFSFDRTMRIAVGPEPPRASGGAGGTPAPTLAGPPSPAPGGIVGLGAAVATAVEGQPGPLDEAPADSAPGATDREEGDTSEGIGAPSGLVTVAAANPWSFPGSFRAPGGSPAPELPPGLGGGGPSTGFTPPPSPPVAPPLLPVTPVPGGPIVVTPPVPLPTLPAPPGPWPAPDPPPAPVGAVPEPGLWAAFIAGFGLVGFALRRARRRAGRVAR